MFDLNQRRTRNLRPTGATSPRRPPQGTRSRTLCLPANDQALARIRPCLEAALQHAGWDGPRQFDVLVATTEALVNAITHGSIQAGSVGVVFSVGPTVARVSVVDRGRGTPAVIPWPPQCPSIDSAHGRGLVMIDAVADRVEIEPCDGGTRITMEFACSAQHACLAA
jgi:anti-sigma regulatory factor (Ser/Thr protein kinase)